MLKKLVYRRQPAESKMKEKTPSKGKNIATRTRRRSDEIAVLTRCVRALMEIQLSIIPQQTCSRYEIARAKVLSARALLEALEYGFDTSGDPPSPKEGV